MSSTVEIQSHRTGERASACSAARVADLTSAHGPLSATARASLRARHGFTAAVRKAALGQLDLHHGNRLLNLIVNDRGRFLVGLLALDLHFNRDVGGAGLTPGRLRQRCAHTGTCSPTRASALLALMRLGEFVRTAPAAQDRRRRELVPTERLLGAQRERWRCQFEAAAPLLPEAALALAALDEPHFVPAMVRRLSDYYDAGFRVLDLVPALRLFGERSGGMFIVLALIAAADEDAIVRGAPVSVSISELARRIGASRTHVIKLINDAAAEGLLERAGAQGIILKPRLSDAVHDFFAIGFLFLAHCAEAIRAAAQEAPSPVGSEAVVPQAQVMPASRLAGETAAR
ncbi:MAG: hypothetical protein K8F92_18775 [Hyphomicrobium sp.]|uniref:hypothetical protein n=1 Tax=Hyphomicrobium sp. TaxID=82 RepID=UPI00132ABA72|nr:hypothetical protein [Hyphomicrobium sp.]KAB2941977.1 MAG: hypothetical protein F9K20_07805 [Hyphomicrobium sp.]MBZ0211675.1 hypothetical protein [Hyphomicrobium sp.]